MLVVGGLYGSYNFFIKMASGGIHQILGAVILQVVAAIVGGAILIMLRLNGQTFTATTSSVLWAVIAGIAVGLAEIASFYVFSRGLNSTIGIPLIIGGTVIVGFLLGWIFLKEPISLTQIGGLGLLLAGIWLVSK